MVQKQLRSVVIDDATEVHDTVGISSRYSEEQHDGIKVQDRWLRRNSLERGAEPS